ncbi:hypothetical protein BDR03DRAFT_987230 [Suillus americanus]|nr:hypothetical protein BDR03DRAFT_987230 [Suillus americanus]
MEGDILINYNLIDFVPDIKIRLTRELATPLCAYGCNSAAYKHFKISLRRCLKADGSRDYLEFTFTCCTAPVNHKPHHRKRMQTGQGTKNLNRGIEECVQRTQNLKAQMAVGS